MDKKNTVLGILLLIAGFILIFWQGKQLPPVPTSEPLPATATNTASDAPASMSAPTSSEVPNARATEMLGLLAQNVDDDSGEVAAPVVRETAPESIVMIANEFIEVEFTNLGGAIREVRFLKTKRGGLDDYIFNKDGYLPALSLGLPKSDGTIKEFDMAYAIESQSESSITFSLQAGPDLKILRTYTLAAGSGDGVDPYIIEHSTRFDNFSDKAKAFSTLYLNLGTMRPIADGAMQQNYLNVGHYDGQDAKFKAINKLTGGKGFLGIGASDPKDSITINSGAPIQWTSVKNQFFAGILSSRTGLASNLVIYPVYSAPGPLSVAVERTGITGSTGYSFGTVPAGSSKSFEFDYFVGPKEFKRLQDLGNGKDLVMQFGFLSFISKLLLAFMYLIHSFVQSWGLSIVIMTICIKIIFWPLTAKASRSQKRMATIQAPMAELKEKYKDNPKKIQEETLKLFREHQVNPVAGCLPLFIQMPIFLGLFYMLRTASELRFEPFLWISDLSQPDTIAEIAGFPINILPLIMGLTMFVQMGMMPINPAADPTQQKIFKFLPLVFLLFLYNFSAGLVLYWTVQNILTIVQQKITNSRPDEPLKPALAAAAPAKTGAGGSPRTKSRKKK
jgi:YidC/Oxa1 family membrane protein insertase